MLFLCNNSSAAEGNKTITSSSYYIHTLLCDDSSSFLVCMRSSTDQLEVNGSNYTLYKLYDYTNNTDSYISLYYREKEGKIYCYDDKKDKEYLILDFTLDKGDIFTDESGNDYIVEESLDTTLTRTYDGQEMGKFRKLELVGINDKDLHDTWIESIGSLHKGLLSSYNIVGAEYNGKKIVSLGEMLNAQNSLNSIYFDRESSTLKSRGTWNSLIMNDTTSLVHVRNNLMDLGFEFVGNSLHMVGTIMGGYDVIKNYYYFTCLIFEKQINIYENSFYWGRQAWGLSPFHVNVYFPGFEEGEYKIKYQDEEDIVLSCPGTTSSIENRLDYYDKHQQPRQLYDLSGRRLNQVPDRGIYIQDGKKVIK